MLMMCSNTAIVQKGYPTNEIPLQLNSPGAGSGASVCYNDA